MYKKGLVSVIIPTRRRSEFLKKAVESVLEQTYKEIELFVVNDNENNDVYTKYLYSLVDSIQDERVLIVEQEKHVNGAAARNAGIRLAQGEYIVFQDDDDFWEPGFLEKQVSALSDLRDDYGAVFCLEKFYKNGELVQVSLPYRSGSLLMPILFRRVGIGPGATLIRHSALDKSGYFDEALSRHQDLQLFAFLSSKYKIKNNPVYLQNREIKDNSNRPTAKQLVQIKSDYYNSIAPLLNTLSSIQKQRFYRLNNLELAYNFYKQNEKKEATELAKEMLLDPIAMSYSIERVFRRIIGKIFRNQLIKIYSNKQ